MTSGRYTVSIHWQRLTPVSKPKLKAERDAARADSRLKARFLSYRLNIPSADESTMLLTVDDWQQAINRECPPRVGHPIVGLDLGAGRAWSAAAACWQNGRIEAIAVAPGIPDIAAQERRDQVPSGTYQNLVNAGQLYVADGVHVPPVSLLYQLMITKWGGINGAVADRFRLHELYDAGLTAVEPRVTRWSEAAADIRALRRLVKDGPLSIAPESQSLIAASLSRAMVKNDDSGNTRLVKQGSHNQGRDDIVAALTLVAGAYERITRARVASDTLARVFNP